MRAKLLAVIAVSLIVTFASRAVGEEEVTAIKCVHLHLDSDFFEIYGNPEVLNEIESFFLFSFDRDPSPNRIPLRYGTPIVVFDAAKEKPQENSVELTARYVDVRLKVDIASKAESRFQLKNDRHFSLQLGDTIMLKSQAEPEDGKSDFLWIIPLRSVKQ